MIMPLAVQDTISTDNTARQQITDTQKKYKATHSGIQKDQLSTDLRPAETIKALT